MRGRYLARPHVVALNKLDLPLEEGGDAALAETRRAASRAVAACAAKAADETAPPVAIVPISGKRGKGMRILKEALQSALLAASDADG